MNTYYNLNGATYILKENFYGLSGWDADKRGGDIYVKAHECCVIDKNKDTCPIVIKKKLSKYGNKAVTFEMAFKVSKENNGFFCKVHGEGSPILNIEVNNGYINYVKGENYIPIEKCNSNIIYGIKADIDIKGKKVLFWVNGIKSAEIPFSQTVDVIDNIEIGVSGGCESKTYIMFVEMYAGFYIHERFATCMPRSFPQDWTISDAFESDTYVQFLQGYDNIDSHILMIEDGRRANKPTVISKSFSCGADDKLCVELKFYFTNAETEKKGIDISLLNDEKEIITISAKECGIYKNDRLLKDHHKNVWQHLKIEADIKKNSAKINLNGKYIGEVSFKSNINAINKLRISTHPLEWTQCLIAQVFAYPILPLDEDYPKPPQKANSNGIHIGMQTCNLWFEGDSAGWDLIEPYSERKSYLGYYYDGSSEVRDWEIKWMAEHGVEFFMPCWYLPDGYRNGPILQDNHSALESYFNAQYKNKLKFAIQFTGLNSKLNSEKFRKYIVPYWVEYFFTDPDYMIIDNKPLVAFTAVASLIEVFGEDGIKEELDYLRDICRSIGYDGAILIGGEQHRTKVHLKTTYKMGFDAIFSYGWGEQCHYESVQEIAMICQKDACLTDVIPSISQGYNLSAWRGNIFGNYLDPEHFEKLLLWAKNDFMPCYPTESIASKTILLDNWNEYGEGHFIMPSELYGFEYLDKVRKTFCGDNYAHCDERPNAEQLKRIDILYPENRKVLKKIKELPKVPNTVNKGWYFEDQQVREQWKVISQIENLHIENGFLSGVSTGNNPCLGLNESICFSGLYLPYVRIRIKISGAQNMLYKFYYITENDKEWNEQKTLSGFVTEAVFEECYVYCANKKTWNDNIIGLRLQPLSSKGEFFISSIEILEYDTKPTRYKINELTDTFFSEPIWENGIMLASLCGLERLLDINLSWDWQSNTILIENKEVNLKFYIDRDFAEVNGEKELISACPKIIDRVAYLPLKFICRKLKLVSNYNSYKKIFEIII